MELARAAQLLLLLLSGFSCRLNRRNFHDAEPEIVGNLSRMLQLILTRTCAAHNMSISISSSYREELPLEQIRLVELVLQRNLRRCDRVAAVPVVLDKQLREELSLRVHLLLFFVQNARQLEHAAALNARANVTHKYKYLVILLVGGGVDTAWERAQMSRIFGYLLRERYNVDVLLLLARLDHGQVDSYTYWPYTAHKRCEYTEPVKQPLQQGRLRDLYPYKVHNLHGCPLHIIVWQIQPYMVLHPSRGAPSSEQISGLDAEILKVLAGKMNFELSLVQNDPPHLIGGRSYMNGTMTGAFRMLQQRRANLTLGFAACLPARYKYLASTLPYSQVEYVLVLRRARPYSAYQIMLFPFDRHVWLLLGALVAVRVLCRLLGWPLLAPIFVAWTLLLYLLRIGYESSVFMYVHNSPSRPLPHSVEQALEQDYNFIVDYATYRMMALLPAFKARTRILGGQPVDIFEQLLALPADSRTAAISSIHFLASYLNTRREQHHRFVLAASKLMDNMVCVHFPLGSYLTAHVNELLFFMRSSGICQHFADRLKWAHIPTTTTTLLRPLRGATPTSTDAAHFQESMRFIYAAFNCLLLAQVLTLFTFALELLSVRIRWSWLSSLLRRL